MQSAKFGAVLLLAVSLSFFAGKHVLVWLNTLTAEWLKLGDNAGESIFVESESVFPDGVAPEHAITISWRSLLPMRENNDDDSANIKGMALDTANDYFDSQYQSFIASIDTNPQHVGKRVRIPGYIVPISLADDRLIKGFFLVPYFGACVHFPAPPPNQMIYVQVRGDFPIPNVYNAYLVEGVLQSDVYEDNRGTSAYFLDLYRVTEYSGEPDDVRNHAG